MHKLRASIFAAAVAAIITIPAGASATIIVAGQSFEDDAFADVVLSSFGIFGPTTLVPNAGPPENALGSSVDTFTRSRTAGAFIELGFVDNLIVNLAGADVGIFERGVLAESQYIALTVGGPTVIVNMFDTGFDTIDGQNVNFGTLDLSDFGLAIGATVSSLAIHSFCDPVAGANGFCNTGDQIVSAVAVVGALNSVSVSEPSALILFAAGLLSLSVFGFRRKKSA